MEVRINFCENFIRGDEPNMQGVIIMYKDVQSKAYELAVSMSSELDMITKMKTVGREVFATGNSTGRVVAFLLFSYGIRTWCESKDWFDILTFIDTTVRIIPPFAVSEVQTILATCSGQYTCEKAITRIGRIIRAIWKYER